MTIDPAVVIGAIAAMGGLLLFIVRAFATGSILPRSTVPRADYDAQIAIVKSYADRFGEQTEAVRALTMVVETEAVAAAQKVRDEATAVAQKLAGRR